MGASKTDEELFREFQRYLHRKQKWQQRQAKADPFALLERMIADVLHGLGQLVGWLVRSALAKIRG